MYYKVIIDLNKRLRISMLIWFVTICRDDKLINGDFICLIAKVFKIYTFKISIDDISKWIQSHIFLGS